MSNQEYFKRVITVKDELDKVSPTFCLAKWLQSTVLLYSGETHSCHHPTRHKVGVEHLKVNNTGIHNTPIKFFARKELLDGKQTAECDYCWRIENSNTENVSDRIYKSGSQWARPFLQKVLDSNVGETINPTYLEVAFESTCNFTCMYCTPDVSTQWMGDIEKNGSYKLHTTVLHDIEWMKQVGKFPIKANEYNPYIESFWKWWPSLYDELLVFRITGGEPLLSKHTWKIFEHIRQFPNKNLQLSINTNLGVPDKLIDRLILELKSIENNVKEIKIFTSAEASGKDAEYIRHGMVYDTFTKNIDRLLTELPNAQVVIMTTINALSVFSFDDFLLDVLTLRAKHCKTPANSPLGLSINYLRWPSFQDIRILPKEIKEQYTAKILELVYKHKQLIPDFGHALFYLEEIDQLERLIKYMNQDLPNHQNLIQDFKLFFNEYDYRHKKDFSSVFPELSFMVK